LHIAKPLKTLSTIDSNSISFLFLIDQTNSTETPLPAHPWGREMKLEMKLQLLMCAVLLLALQVSPSHAQAARTWVSGVGDDANACSRTAPCKTFAGAISKTTAGGEIDVLDAGGFGTLTITKALTVDGGGGQVASVLASGTNAIAVQAGTGVVTLRNLSINGGGTGLSGIVFNSGAALIVENCNILGFLSHAIAVSTASGTSHIAVLNSTFSNNGQGGIQVKTTGGTTTVSVRGVQAVSNGFGIGIDTTGGGTVSLIMDRTTANENTTGIQALGTNTTALINNSTIVHNGTGLNITAPASVSSYVDNAINQNTTNIVGTLGTKPLQ
jgi:hypothetical protein